METNTISTQSISLDNLGIKNAQVHYQLSAEELHAITVE